MTLYEGKGKPQLYLENLMGGFNANGRAAEVAGISELGGSEHRSPERRSNVEVERELPGVRRAARRRLRASACTRSTSR